MFDGKKLKELRESERYSQSGLAKEISKVKKVTQAQICNHETGERSPSYELVCAYANFFGKTTDYFRRDNNE